MEEIVYKVNFNFETKLSGSNKKNKAAAWFDHIFFFINKNPNASLKSEYGFSTEYLEYLKSLNLASVRLDHGVNAENWWSNDEDDNRNKFFNSKVTMTKLGLEQNWIPIKTTIGKQTQSEYSKKIVAREEWGYSGRGTYYLNDPSEKISQNGNFVISEFVEKIKDFGVTFILDSDEFFIIENYIDERGQFKGGEILENNSFVKEIGEDNFNQLVSIKNHLKQLGAKGSVQLDTFTYNDGFHPFVEVNYRKTMGLMIYSLSKLMKKKYVSWKIYKNIKTDLDYQLEEFENSIVVSPIDKFVSICISSDDLNTFENEQIRLEKFFGQGQY